MEIKEEKWIKEGGSEGKKLFAWIFNLRFNEVIRTLVIYSLEQEEKKNEKQSKEWKSSKKNNNEFLFVFIYSSNSCSWWHGVEVKATKATKKKTQEKSPFKKQLKVEQKAAFWLSFRSQLDYKT